MTSTYPERETFDWRIFAACKGMDPELFFPSRGNAYPGEESDLELARAVCRSCPTRDACLDYALSNREEFGMWGGLSGRERLKIRRNRRRAS